MPWKRPLLAPDTRGSAEEAIRDAVDRLLVTASVTAPPAPLELLGSLRDVRWIEPLPMPVAGRLVPLPDGGYIIQVNDAETPGRQRFSIAHEICHTFFDEARQVLAGHEDSVTALFEADGPEEHLCDVGAARMLLHPRWLGALLDGHAPSLDRLFEVATACETSAEATARQIAAQGLWRRTFIVWEPGFRRGEPAAASVRSEGGSRPRLRAARVYSPPGMPFFPLRKSVAETSSVAAARHSRERTTGIERFDLGREQLTAECASQYVGYVDDGREVERVLTLLRWL